MSDDTIRCFVAIELASDLRQAAVSVADAIRERVSDAEARCLRWVRPEALHVTLRFLGNIEASRVGEIARSISASVRGLAPFTLSLGELIGLPGDRRPRVFALDVQPTEALASLAAAVERGVREAQGSGARAEARRFRAHLTLARVREGRGRVRLPELRGVRAAMPVDEIVVFRSELGARASAAPIPGASTGPTYTPLERIALGGSDFPRSRTISANQPTKEPR